jgi:hypothetical protein
MGPLHAVFLASSAPSGSGGNLAAGLAEK